jgi:predicted RNA binding protein YcfA (HicA-like mRNA interferase family)
MPKLRPLSADEVGRIPRKHGFVRLRQAGSHIMYRLDLPGGDSRTVPVLYHREIAKGTLKSIIDLSGLDAALFRK